MNIVTRCQWNERNARCIICRGCPVTSIQSPVCSGLCLRLCSEAAAVSDQGLYQVLGPLTGSRSQQTFSLEALTGGSCPQGPHGASGSGILKSNTDKRGWFEFGCSLDAEGILRAQQIWMCVAFFGFFHLERTSRERGNGLNWSLSKQK